MWSVVLWVQVVDQIPKLGRVGAFTQKAVVPDKWLNLLSDPQLLSLLCAYISTFLIGRQNGAHKWRDLYVPVFVQITNLVSSYFILLSPADNSCDAQNYNGFTEKIFLFTQISCMKSNAASVHVSKEKLFGTISLQAEQSPSLAEYE